MANLAIPEIAKSAPVKVASAYRTISEAAELLAVPQHVLRFWETKFPQIRPMKRSGGRRYYRPEDIDTLKTIQNLLYEQGYTIKGVQRLLRLRRGLATQTLDDAVAMEDDLFDTQAVSEALMLNAPEPTMDSILADVQAAAADVIDAQAEIDVYAEIPDHLPAKPAALMAAGIEAGRPYPGLEQAVETMPAVAMPAEEPVVEAAPTSLVLSSHQRARMESLLAELIELKTLLV